MPKGSRGGSKAGAGGSGSGGSGDKKTSAEANVMMDGFGKDSSADVKIQKEIDKFREEHKDSKTEFGVVIDENGNITSRVSGGQRGVDMVAGKGKLSVHNHPSGATMFSAGDLVLLGTDGMNGAKGAVVTTKNGTVMIKTGKNFKGLEFASQFYSQNARMRWNFASEEQCDAWLKKNQSKYGYTYKRVMKK